MKDQVMGTWALESFEIEDSNGSRKPWGEEAHGLLIYTDSGHMSVGINRKLTDSQKTKAELAFDSSLFYSGTYFVNDSIITHQVTEASNPARIGKSQTRYAKLDGELLTLTSPKESFGTAILTWRKI